MPAFIASPGMEIPEEDPGDEDSVSLMLGPLLDSAIEQGQKIAIPAHRIFCEALAQGMSATEAVLFAIPGLRGRAPGVIARAISRIQRDPAVQNYTKAVFGVGAFQAGISYAEKLHQLDIEASDAKNPPYVRVSALTALIGSLEQNGIAAAEGFTTKDGGQDAGKSSDPLDGAEADEFLVILSQPVKVAELPPGEG